MAWASQRPSRKTNTLEHRDAKIAKKCPVKQARGRSLIHRGRAVSTPEEENFNHETLETHERKAAHNVIERIDRPIHADDQLAEMQYRVPSRLGEFQRLSPVLCHISVLRLMPLNMNAVRRSSHKANPNY
jgi:hypothetical protein